MDFKDIALLMMLFEDLEGRRRGPWLSCRSRRGASTASTSVRPPGNQMQEQMQLCVSSHRVDGHTDQVDLRHARTSKNQLLT